MDSQLHRYTESFLGVTAHGFDRKSLLPHQLTLACCPFSPPHTAEAIYKLFDSVLKDWAITRDRVSFVVTDNAAAMIAAFKNYISYASKVRNTKSGEEIFQSALADINE